MPVVTSATMPWSIASLLALMLFSGALVPMEVIPQTVQAIPGYFPLTHLETFLRGM
ncbi:MAG: hypothetical protein JSV42_17630 [Chloroflexota bacterium]|nr:MAG: hypothetical protein JSV42_17630 [Chloroflexota bacterium]